MKPRDANTKASNPWELVHKELKALRQALHKIEKNQHGGVDYSKWSQAKGSLLGQAIAAPQLPPELLEDCRLLPSRYHLLQQLPQNGIGAEIGTQFGTFTENIIQLAKPRQLHLFDLSFSAFSPERRNSLAENCQLHFHEGDSSTNVSALPDQSLDWVYIDGDHTYDGVRKDLQAVRPKLSAKGLILCNDYTPWSLLEALPYGIPKAVHEFCLDNQWHLQFLALHPWGYHDIALAATSQKKG